MQTKTISGLTLLFDQNEQKAAELIGQACEKSVQTIQGCWGLDTPEDCRVYVMTSWLRFLFHAPSWPYRILVAATLPLWYFRARKLWALAGGWHQQFGQRRAVGVKPPHLLKNADTAKIRSATRLARPLNSIACSLLTRAAAVRTMSVTIARCSPIRP